MIHPVPSVPGTGEGLDFDSAAVPDGRGFEQYRELYGIGTQVVRTGPVMRAQLRGWRLDRMLLYDRRLHDVGHRRDARRVEADGFDHFTVTLLLTGGITVIHDEGTVRMQPGEALLLDTAAPSENRMDQAHLVTIAVARERLAAITGAVDGLHGLVLSTAQVTLFREFVELLLRNLPQMSRNAKMAAAGVLTTLLTVAIDNAGIDRTGARSAQAERLAQLRRVVNTHLSDPAFDVAAMARRSGLSRPTLYRVLAAYGGVATFIRHRRLEHLRRQLANPAEVRTLTLLATEAGFASASDASRAFFDRYDVRPSEYRAIVVAGMGAGSARTLRLWLDEVR